MKRTALFLSLLALLAFPLGCSHDEEKQYEEAKDAIRSSDSDKELEVDKDVLGDDEIEIND